MKFKYGILRIYMIKDKTIEGYFEKTYFEKTMKSLADRKAL